MSKCSRLILNKISLYGFLIVVAGRDIIYMNDTKGRYIGDYNRSHHNRLSIQVINMNN